MYLCTYLLTFAWGGLSDPVWYVHTLSSIWSKKQTNLCRIESRCYNRIFIWQKQQKNYQIQVKVARKTTDFKTFIYGRTCTARVQEHVQRCSSRFTSTKFNSCTEIITVRHVSQIWFLARYTVIIVTLTTTTKSERIVLSRSGRGRSSCSPPDSTCWPGRCYYPVWSSLRPNCWTSPSCSAPL